MNKDKREERTEDRSLRNYTAGLLKITQLASPQKQYFFKPQLLLAERINNYVGLKYFPQVFDEDSANEIGKVTAMTRKRFWLFNGISNNDVKVL